MFQRAGLMCGQSRAKATGIVSLAVNRSHSKANMKRKGVSVSHAVDVYVAATWRDICKRGK